MPSHAVHGRFGKFSSRLTACFTVFVRVSDISEPRAFRSAAEFRYAFTRKIHAVKICKNDRRYDI